jgi:hypothetical protein
MRRREGGKFEWRRGGHGCAIEIQHPTFSTPRGCEAGAFSSVMLHFAFSFTFVFLDTNVLPLFFFQFVAKSC